MQTGAGRGWLASLLTVTLVTAATIWSSTPPPLPDPPSGAHSRAASDLAAPAPEPPSASARPLSASRVPQGPAGTSEPVSDDRWALLIGIDRASGAPPLQGAVGDVRLLERALLAYGFDPGRITVLTDAQASRDAVLASIRRFAARVPPDAKAVFAFAGHTRRHGGENSIVAADGRTIAAGTLAAALGRIRSPLWVALPTCYAAGFSRSGIVGPDRVATFASSADARAYESVRLGHSFLFEYLVAQAMLDGRASGSVEEAFGYAERHLQRDHPRWVPLLDDRHPGEFTLGPPIPPSSETRPGSEASRPRRTPPPDDRPEARPHDEEPPEDETRDEDQEEEESRRSGATSFRACARGVQTNGCRSQD